MKVWNFNVLVLWQVRVFVDRHNTICEIADQEPTTKQTNETNKKRWMSIFGTQ
jgi:hypothetical protein